MNKIIVIGSVVLAASVACAGTASNLTREQIKQQKAARLAQLGGYVTQKLPSTVIRFANAQKVVPSAKMEEMTTMFGKTFGINVELRDVTPEKCAFATAAKTLSVSNTAFAVAIVDDPSLPTLTAAPESRWSVVNVRPLMADSPTDELLGKRVKKEMWRGMAYACGVGITLAQPCVLDCVHSLAELDRTQAAVAGPDTLRKLFFAAKKLGVTQERRVTYRMACQEGWAPAPTNDAQKAVWERAKAERSKQPTKGIKVEFDPKKGE